ncbi:YhcH/YjgK/YiaL family protein [Aerococcaceae bacterium zg-BR9]|uniref:YhcH/YjgK/YiaL family protein n=1 Tax=Aerococcaceae bacterium zg-1292 TaxID=2774330 RepID=UPI0040637FEB|nr:YhcH/YjgK/YiaL family protein [Aerococcaceae bacterium zg-BR9]
MILDYLTNLPRYAAIIPRFEQFSNTIMEVAQLPLGRTYLTDVDFVNVMAGETLPLDKGMLEYHRDYLDIQIILSGQEVMKWQNIHHLNEKVTYDAAKDIGFLDGEGEYVTIKEGMFYLVFPEDAHLPSSHIDQPNTYKKAVVKIKVN